jgi:hypothetical protein
MILKFARKSRHTVKNALDSKSNGRMKAAAGGIRM